MDLTAYLGKMVYFESKWPKMTQNEIFQVFWNFFFSIFMREITELKLTLISFLGYILQFISQKRPERD